MDFSNRYKVPANKIHKQKQHKSSQREISKQESITAPSFIHISIPTTISNANILSTKMLLEPSTQKTLFSNATKSFQSNDEEIKLPTNSNAQIYVAIKEDARSLQNLEHVESKINESANFQITLPKKLNNLKATNDTFNENTTEYPSLNYATMHEKVKLKEYYSKNIKDYDHRKRLESFVVSDLQPQSFRPQQESISSSNVSIQGDSFSSHVNSTIPPRSLTYLHLSNPKPFHHNQETVKNKFRLRTENYSINSTQSVLPLYERHHSTIKTPSIPVNSHKSTINFNVYSTNASTTTTTNASKSHVFEELTPTTHAPIFRIWRGSVSASTLNDTLLNETESKVRYSPELDLNNTSNKTRNSSNNYFITEQPLQSFTARANVFKDNLTKTTGIPTHRFVSPYKSLETMLDDRILGTRTTIKPRYSSMSMSTPVSAFTTKKPLDSNVLLKLTGAKNYNENLSKMSTSLPDTGVSDKIFNAFPGVYTESTNTSTLSTAILTTLKTNELETTTTKSSQINTETIKLRGRLRFVAAVKSYLVESDSTKTYNSNSNIYPKTLSNSLSQKKSVNNTYPRKIARTHIKSTRNEQQILIPKNKGEKHQSLINVENKSKFPKSLSQKNLHKNPIENESTIRGEPRAEALVSHPIEIKQENSIEGVNSEALSGTIYSDEQLVPITERPLKFIYSNKYRQKTAEKTLVEGLQNAGYISSSNDRPKYRTKSVLEDLRLFLAEESDESKNQNINAEDFRHPEIKAAVEEMKEWNFNETSALIRPTTTTHMPQALSYLSNKISLTDSTTPYINLLGATLVSSSSPTPSINTSSSKSSTASLNRPISSTDSAHAHYPNSTFTSSKFTKSSVLTPMRASRINNAIKSSIAAAATSTASLPSKARVAASVSRNQKFNNGSTSSFSLGSKINIAAAVKCSDSISNARCNEIPSRYLKLLLII